MQQVRRITVGINFGEKQHEVGELVWQEGRVFFRYYTDFLDAGLAISPFKLPVNSQTHAGNPQLFGGLFGVFDDSLPDGWGRLLIDRTLASKGIPLVDVTPLDRLTYVNTHGMGALTYLPKSEITDAPSGRFNPDTTYDHIQEVLAGESSEVIETLAAAGGSSGGARPKVLIRHNPKSGELVYGSDELNTDYEHWIIKFRSSADDPEIAAIEMAYYEMAKAAGIRMHPSQLFQGKGKMRYFGTKRFDRAGSKRIHMHSAAGLLHDDFRATQLDYGHLLHNGYELTKKARTYEEIFRLAAFNVLSHNRDDHSKNFSFLMDETGDWQFAPAYDLTFSNSTHGFHSTSIAEESAAPAKKHLMRLADHFLIRNADKILEEVHYAVSQWTTFAADCGLSKTTTQNISTVLKRVRATF